MIAGHERHAGASISALAAAFEPIARIAAGRRADEDDAGRGAGLGELGVLRQEAVAGMDRLGAAVAARPR